MNLTIDATLNHENAAAWLCTAQARLGSAASGASVTVDASALREFDSSALAVLLALLRNAQQHNVGLVLQSMPTKLLALAEVYGVDTLLVSTA